MKWVRRRGMSAIAGLGAGLALLLAGCGAPHYTYVANTTSNTYFKVPYGWQPIKSTALIKAITGGSSSSDGAWTVGYDASRVPSAQHVLGTVTTSPFVYASVGQLNQSTQDLLSYNVLKDFFLPVTSTARTTASQDGFPLTDFKLLASANLAPGQGVHGVSETYDYTFPGGRVVTFDQIALTNSTDTEVYLLLVHCTATCFSQNKTQISTVMNSFTVRSS
jgi:hypothetical protein